LPILAGLQIPAAGSISTSRSTGKRGFIYFSSVNEIPRKLKPIKRASMNDYPFPKNHPDLEQ
jgi:hypothetical protein